MLGGVGVQVVGGALCWVVGGLVVGWWGFGGWERGGSVVVPRNYYLTILYYIL